MRLILSLVLLAAVAAMMVISLIIKDARTNLLLLPLVFICILLLSRELASRTPNQITNTI